LAAGVILSATDAAAAAAGAAAELDSGSAGVAAP